MGTGISKLSNEDLRFLKEKTNMDKDEIKEWYKNFMRVCPDGQLSKKQFKEAYKEFFPGGNPDKFYKHVFRSFDKDGSGTIAFNEFLLVIDLTSSRGDQREKVNWAFSIYNIDGNGVIDMSEMETILEAIFMLDSKIQELHTETPKERTIKIFAKFDSSSDGFLSKEEFVQGCMDDKGLYMMLTADLEGPWKD